VEFAEGEARRVAQLAASGGASAQAVERAQMERRTAREELTSLEFGARVADHQVQIARAALGRLSARATAEEAEQMDVSSPVDGIVLRVAQESEGVVQVGAPLMELGDPAALEIVVDVLTSDAVRIERGAHVEIDRWGGELLQGHVRLIEPSAFTRTSALGVEEQRVNVLVDLDSPREEWISLGDGYRVEARVVVWEAEDVVIVPASAVFRRGEGSAVFVIEGDHARLTPIEVGHGNGLDTEVVSGLDEGATVIVHPGDTVDDGVLVAPRR
jgi:HlyD family secretion protein